MLTADFSVEVYSLDILRWLPYVLNMILDTNYASKLASWDMKHSSEEGVIYAVPSPLPNAVTTMRLRSQLPPFNCDKSYTSCQYVFISASHGRNDLT